MKEEVIAFTKVKLPFGWMQNMSAHPIRFRGDDYRSSEALFQCLRFQGEAHDLEMIRFLIRKEKSPMGAKMIAKQPEIKAMMTVKPFSQEDVDNMNLCVMLKLAQHPELQPELVATGILPLIEDVTARGSGGSNLFWGAMLMEWGEWIGKNKLGGIWMAKRTLLSTESGKNFINEDFKKFSEKE